MTYFAKDEMRITLGSLLNIFMSLAIKGRLFIAEFDTKISKNGVSIMIILPVVRLERKLVKIAICQSNWLFQIALS